MPSKNPKKQRKGKGKKKDKKPSSSAVAASGSSSTIQNTHQLNQLIEKLSLGDTSCNHGYPVNDDVYFQFIKDFEVRLVEKICANVDQMEATIDLHIENLNTDLDRSKILQAVVALGTTYALREDEGSMRVATSIALFTMMFENTTDHIPSGLTDKDLSTIQGLSEDRHRKLAQFFSKRLSCSCLDSKYKELKKLGKMGNCHFCRERKELKELLLCTGCRLQHYCSRKCQVSAWRSYHKKDCAKLGANHANLAADS